MNKTININLGGFFFHIDESAYEILKKYLGAISRSLSDDPKGKDEILADIEARISELLSEKILDSRQVVNEEDIQSIIKIMGQPEDYADVDDAYTDYSTSYKTSANSGKKMYRDGDDKFLGGVSSGLAHYFDIDPIWIRLLFILLLVAGSFGFWIYIVLWIFVPEARTTAEKLQMQGDPVNIDNIEKKIRDEFETVSNKIKNADYTGVKTGFQSFLDALGIIFLRFFKIISKLAGVLLILSSIGLLIASVAATLTNMAHGGSFAVNEIWMQELPFLYNSILPIWVLFSCIAIAVIIPLIMLFYLGIRIVSNSVKQMNKIVALSLLGIWMVAFLTLIFTGIEFQSKNTHSSSKIHNQDLEIETKDSLHLKIVSNDDLLFENFLRRNANQTTVVDNTIEKLYNCNIYLDIKKSETDKSYVKIRRKSEGIDYRTAAINANEVEYNYEFINNELILNSYFLSPMNHRFKNESVTVTLYLTDDINLFINESTENFLHKYKTVERMKRWKMINHYFVMTSQGLECTDCFRKENIDI